MHVGCPGPTTTNPWTYKFRSYLLPSYSTDIWKTIERLDIWLLYWKQTLWSSRHLTHHSPTWTTLHVECPGPTTTNPWTCKSRSYLLPSYSTDIWKTIKRLDIWHASRLKTNTSIVQALDPPPAHLDNTVKVPNFKQCTSDAQGPPPPTPGYVSSGPIFCLHTRQISERQ